ncbi:MAG: insulinase family protein, partial [Armatimonadetes bacterium]|nr:insulinase family protein [Armatimonadota bacterium]
MPHSLTRPLLAAIFLALLPVLARGQDVGPVRTTLPNGIRIVCRRENTPLVAVDVFVRTGVAQETERTAGLSNFVARTVLASTTDSTPEQIQHDIGALGGNVSTTWQPEWTQINALTVRDQFKQAAFLLTEVLKKADFDAGVVEDTRQQILSDIDGRDADLFQTAYGGIRQALYPGSGYALPSAGTLQSVQRLRRADLIAFYERYYVPRNFIVVVVGDVDPQDAIATLAEYMDDFPAARVGRRGDQMPAPPPGPTQDPVPIRLYQPDLDETAVMVGYRVAPATSPDYPALLVANALLGGMKTSRLFSNLRE